MNQIAKPRKRSIKKIQKNSSFPIVAIGSSAGGLEAISALLKNLPTDTGMAYIYVQHLNPDQKSLTTSLLSRQTKMKVQEIQQMELMKPNNVYVIPNNKGIEVTNGHIKLFSRDKKEKSNLSVDTLFVSLAQTHADEVIGIVLSGNANDGTLGLRAIKSEGGITFAQDGSAKNNSMPRSAISEGVVDFILSPKKIALNLGKFGEYFKKHGTLHYLSEKSSILTNAELKTILSMVYEANGIDFSLYKENTIRRRILRRVLLNNLADAKKYIKFLTTNKAEVEILQSDLLINFTSFFRDSETYDYLKKNLFPKLLTNRTDRDPLRIWTVACSTGEEAYSLAIILHEIIGKQPARGRIQIFATDLSASAIRKARLGIFTKEELKDVSLQRKTNYFTENNQGYRINKSIRDMCVFAVQNVLSEPPFSRLDLICCCNMLIYMDVAAQQKIMSTFHYSLKDNGYLVLGKSETIGSSGYLFNQHHKKLKIYSSKIHSSKPVLKEKNLRLPSRHLNKIKKHTATKAVPAIQGELERRFENILLNRFFPACVVINAAMDIVLFRGTTSSYLENSSGKASLNILKMAKAEIAFDLRNLINKAVAVNQIVKSALIPIQSGKEKKNLVIEIAPFNGPADELFYLVLFMEINSQMNSENENKDSKHSNKRTKKIEQQLSKLKSDMILMSSNHDGSTLALQSANEEITSSNEELQSLNEELETSREEIESTNEELNATIQELLTQNQLLAESYRYSEDIIATLHEPMIVLDHDLNVKTANASFYKFFNLKSEVIEGKPFYKIDNRRWDIPKLQTLLDSILSKNTDFNRFPVSFKLPSKKQIHLLLNAKRIVQKGHRKNLILLAMADISPAASKK